MITKQMTPKKPETVVTREALIEQTAKWTDRTMFLPPASVRAFAMLSTLFASIIFISQGVEIPEWFTSLTIMAFGYYFGHKNGSK